MNIYILCTFHILFHKFSSFMFAYQVPRDPLKKMIIQVDLILQQDAGAYVVASELGTAPKLMQMIDPGGVSMMFQPRMTYNLVDN